MVSSKSKAATGKRMQRQKNTRTQWDSDVVRMMLSLACSFSKLSVIPRHRIFHPAILLLFIRRSCWGGLASGVLVLIFLPQAQSLLCCAASLYVCLHEPKPHRAQLHIPFHLQSEPLTIHFQLWTLLQTHVITWLRPAPTYTTNSVKNASAVREAHR